MEWTRDKTLALIQEYRRRRGLWDMTHEDYRKKEIKHNLLVEVSACLGGKVPVVEIEKKFHTLRTQYHREISRMARKEPYNSKWFGFKNLQFLSSPKACRMGKGRIKSEITEDGTVTKYIIRESPIVPAECNGLGGSNSTLNEEFVSLPRKPTKHQKSSRSSASASRARELEKLIEETTKDVDDIEDQKPKISKRNQSAALEQHTYNSTEQQNNHEAQNDIEDQQQLVETIDLQTGGDNNFQATPSPNGTAHHSSLHQTVPARIIKIQRRETSPDDEYYDDDEPQGQIKNSAKHHIYYETNGQQHTATIVAPSLCAAAPSANISMASSGHSTSKGAGITSGFDSQQRDDLTTYGEYVANEMRGIKNRQILVALKHKINTALFEASMAELQK